MSNARKPANASVAAKSFADIMAAADSGRPTKTVQVCFSTDLHDRYTALDNELAEALEAERQQKERAAAPEGKASGQRMVSHRRSKAVEDEMQALIDDNPHAFYDVKIQAARHSEWVQAKAEHPPISDIRNDSLGVHWDSFLPVAIRMCMVDPEPTDEVLTFLGESMTTGEWDRLGLVAFQLSEGVRETPKSRSLTSIPNGSADG